MENLDFGRGHGLNFDHLTMVILKFCPWSWSNIFDHMTMTPRRRPNGQKIMVALPPPPNLFLRKLQLDQPNSTGMTNPPYILDYLEDMAVILSHPRVYSFLHVPVQAGWCYHVIKVFNVISSE